jgi:N-acetylglutamate synthase-like GNAT family acetyltransferase
MVEVREQAAADGEQVTEIVALATEDLRRVYGPAPRHKQTSTPEEDRPMTLVAVERNIVVGVIEYCVRPDELYIRGLAVHPRQRQRGIARVLIHSIEQIAIGYGKAKVTLSTIKETGNPVIFARFGFTVVNEATAEGFQRSDGQPVTKVNMCRMLA